MGVPLPWKARKEKVLSLPAGFRPPWLHIEGTFFRKIGRRHYCGWLLPVLPKTFLLAEQMSPTPALFANAPGLCVLWVILSLAKELKRNDSLRFLVKKMRMKQFVFFFGLALWSMSCSNNAGTAESSDTTIVSPTPDNAEVSIDTNYGTRPGSDTLMVGTGR